MAPSYRPARGAMGQQALSLGAFIIALAVASFVSSPVGAAGEPAERVTLLGKTTVRGSESGWVPVTLRHDSGILSGGSKVSPTGGVSIRGGGRMAALVVTSDPPSGPDEIVFLAGRFLTCSKPGCSDGKRFGFSFGDSERDDDVRLPAGDYRLYLLTDGEPLQVAFRLKGLDGTTRLSTLRKAPLDLKTLESSALDGSADRTYAAGDTFKSGSRGLILTFLYGAGERSQRFDSGICHFAGPMGPPKEVAYGPQCSAAALAGTGAGSVTLGQEGEGFWEVFLTSYDENTFPPSADGTQGLGAWITSPDTLREAVAHAAFLPLSMD